MFRLHVRRRKCVYIYRDQTKLCVRALSLYNYILVILVRCVVKVKKMVPQIDICSVDCTRRISTVSTELTIYAELVNTDDESDDFQQFEK